jgi:hypothetical protein
MFRLRRRVGKLIVSPRVVYSINLHTGNKKDLLEIKGVH